MKSLRKEKLVLSTKVAQAPRRNAARESEDRFAKLFHGNPVPAAISSYPDGKLLDVNDAYVRTFGFERSEMLGRTTVSLGIYADPADRDTLFSLFRSNGSVRGHEVMCYSKAGALLHMLLFWERIELDGAPCILTMAYDFTERKRIEDHLRRSETYLVEAQRVSSTGSWAMNPAIGTLFWSEEMYRISGFDISQPPPTFSEVMDRVHPEDRQALEENLKDAIRRGADLSGEYRMLMPDGSMKYLHYLGHKVVPAPGAPAEYVGTVVDITSRKLAEAQLNSTLKEMRSLAARLMHARDRERRRIARELHETTAQDLAAIKMNLAALELSLAGSLPQREKDRTLLAECAQLTQQAITDIRTLSYVLHPPLLDEAGLPAAIRWFATGFTKRSGVQVHLSLAADFGRLPSDIEIALFRVVQESLINIQRHAQSPIASIALRTRDGDLELVIRDRGRGMPRARGNTQRGQNQKLGVGIASMRERIEELKGTLTIDSTPAGTRIIARLRLPTDTG